MQKGKDKIKLFAMGNDNENDYIYFIIEKKQDSFRWLEKLFVAASLEGLVDFCDIEMGKYKTRWNKGLTDLHTSYEMENSCVDIFYGQKRIFIALHASTLDRQRLRKALRKMTFMHKRS